MSATVALARCDDYNQDRVQQAVNQALELLGGIGSFAQEYDRVLLKPNILLSAEPEKAVCTHPEMLRAVIRAFKAFGCQVIVAEQPGIAPASQIKKAVETSGIAQVCRDEKTPFRLFRSNGYVPVDLPDGKQIKQVMLPRDFYEVDLIVSVAKLKSHMQAGYSGAIKNFYGAIPTMQRKQIHRLAKYVPFSEGIVDVFQASKPGFAIMDAIVGMEGKGPTEGDPKKLGLVLASTDLVALDRVAVNIVDWDRYSIHHINDAAARGLGEGDIKKVQIVGEKLDEVKTPFVPPPTMFRNPPRFLMNALYNVWSIKPVVVPETCIACGTCVGACPTQAITMKDLPSGPIAVIDYDKCIECFCCHELCAYGAIEERKSVVKRLEDRLRKALKAFKK